MKQNKKIFSILEKIEKKKIEQKAIKIKDLYIKKTEHNKQLKLLIDYQKEYIKKLHEKKISGILINDWNNYNAFLSVLHSIIENHKNTISDNNEKIIKNLDTWSKNQIRLKVWKHFNLKIKKRTIKLKRLLAQRIIEECVHLQAFRKGFEL